MATIYLARTNYWEEIYSSDLRDMFDYYEAYCDECYGYYTEPMSYMDYFKSSHRAIGISPAFEPTDTSCYEVRPLFDDDNNVIDLKAMIDSISCYGAVSRSFASGRVYVVCADFTNETKFYFCKQRKFDTKEEMIADMNADWTYYSDGYKAGI